MKHLGLAAGLAALLSSGAAMGADINGSLKDTVADYTPSSINRSGFYINGAIGWATTDRNIRGRIAGEKYEAIEVLPEGDEAVRAMADEIAADPVFTEGNLLVDHIMGFGGSENVDSFVFGGGVSYLFHMPSTRFAVELGLDVTGYANNETKLSFTGISTDYPGTDDEKPSEDTTSGSVKFRRDFDIDLVLKGHFFLTDRWSIYGGGGLSYARASIKGGHSNTNEYTQGDDLDPIYVNSYDDKEGSFGYVLAAGTKIWINDKISLDLDYNYKNHKFDFGGSSSAYDAGANNGYGAIRNSHDKGETEDDTHTVKAKIGWKLN